MDGFCWLRLTTQDGKVTHLINQNKIRKITGYKDRVSGKEDESKSVIWYDDCNDVIDIPLSELDKALVNSSLRAYPSA